MCHIIDDDEVYVLPCQCQPLKQINVIVEIKRSLD
jgi:hypothetical protein